MGAGGVIVTRRVQRLAVIALCLPALALAGCSLGDDPPTATPAPQRSTAAPDATPAGTTATKNTTRLGGADAAVDAAVVAQAVFPGAGAAARPRAVALVDLGDWQAGIAAGMLAAAPVGAAVLVSDGAELPPVTRAALARLRPRGASALGGAQVIRVGARPPAAPGLRSSKISGDDPYELAAAVDRAFSRAKGELSKQVVVISGERPEHGMAAAAWAARSGDSVLFVRRDEVPAATVRALRDRRRPQIFLLGPESVIGRGTEQRLRGLGSVRRIEGATPEETAIRFARYRTAGFGWGVDVPGANFTVASTARPLGAAAAAALGSNGVFAPLLLTSSPDRLPAPLEGYLLDLQPGYEGGDPSDAVFNRVWILGDESAVSARVQARIDQLAELVPVDADG